MPFRPAVALLALTAPLIQAFNLPSDPLTLGERTLLPRQRPSFEADDWDSYFNPPAEKAICQQWPGSPDDPDAYDTFKMTLPGWKKHCKRGLFLEFTLACLESNWNIEYDPRNALQISDSGTCSLNFKMKRGEDASPKDTQDAALCMLCSLSEYKGMTQPDGCEQMK